MTTPAKAEAAETKAAKKKSSFAVGDKVKIADKPKTVGIYHAKSEGVVKQVNDEEDPENPTFTLMIGDHPLAVGHDDLTKVKDPA